MENTWLLAEDSSAFESESDEEEKQLELESRLYSVVHHNDLSQPLPASLAEQFSVECSDSGEVAISLIKPVDDLLANVNQSRNDINGSVPNLDDSDDVVIVNETAPAPHNRENNRKEFSFAETPVLRKRFRYSDINIDEVDKLNGSTNNSLVEDNNTEINYFKPIDLKSVRKKKRFGEIKLPTNTTLPVQDWKSNSNSQFISVKLIRRNPTMNYNILNAMTDMLKKENPNVGKSRLRDYANLLYVQNAQNNQQGNDGTANNNPVTTNQNSNQNTPNMIHSKTTQSHQYQSGRSSDNQTTRDVDKSNSVISNDPTINGIKSHSMEKCQVIEINDDESDNSICLAKKNKKNRKKKDVQTPNGSGSISLNISPFKPMVNLSSDDEDSKLIVPSTPVSCKASRRNLPHKWTKEMVKFYTTPSKRKLNQSFEQIHNRLKEQSEPKDWELDYQDRIGIGMFKSGNIWTKKCSKCGHRGHDPQKCSHVVKCCLCAGRGHSIHNCPNIPCLTCGVQRQQLGMDQECRNCYMLYMSNEACRICLSHDHHTGVCPDSWRSFHATVDGEKKVPKNRQENPRKWCCNCARRGHFSHECPLPVFSKQPSPFVVNYLLESSQDGSVYVTVPPEGYEIINNVQADLFLQNLSNQSGAFMEVTVKERESTITVCGNFEQCNFIKREIEQYVNTKKRTIQQPTFKNKRRKLK